MFEITHRSGMARTGRLHTPHGVVETPAFVAVGTQATVKAVPPADLQSAGVQALFANTYHLCLRPGPDVIARLGGLHRFMAWDGPILTDSGGFQVFSLGAAIEHGVGKIASIFPDESRGRPGGHTGESLVRLDDDGVTFRSHLDGSTHRFTPESVIDIQRKLGADIILVLDECTSPLHDRAYTAAAMERTHRWAERALARFQATAPAYSGPTTPQALFGIVQGGAYRDLREQSARFITGLDFDGIAIGGSLGKSKRDMRDVLEWTVPLLPEQKARHLLGIGEVPDIFAVVERGVDTFDCVAPTRMARNGSLLTRRAGPERKFRLNLRNARFRDDPQPVDPDCPCPTCRQFSRAYLHHLIRAREILAYHLATVHNLYFMTRLMADIRHAIRHDRLDELRAEWVGE
jgi:tRNA-guanine transglycosylase